MTEKKRSAASNCPGFFIGAEAFLNHAAGMRNLTYHWETWPLASPFRISRRTVDQYRCVLVAVGEGTHQGFGEARGIYYLGETEASMTAQIESVREAIAAGATRETLLDLLSPGGARNAIDCALWDLEAKQTDSSIWDLLGSEPRLAKTAMTLGVEDDLQTLAAKAQAASHFSTLKLKLARDGGQKAVAAVRAARPDATIIVDANQAIAPKDLDTVLEALHAARVAMVEQPLPRGEDDMLKGYVNPIPLCADESCQSRADLAEVADRYDMINIKLDKTGGLTEALHLAKAAKAMGLEIMLGNMLGTSLAMAAALPMVADARFVDLDGPLWLKQDRQTPLMFQGEQIHWTPGVWGPSARNIVVQPNTVSGSE
ncbi:MAG: enolase C-terminal domain-like protein [Pseudomonadota bacterium]